MKNEKMEIFKKNMESRCLSTEFIKRALNYFKELEEEKVASDYNNIEEVIDYYNHCGSFTYNTLQSEENLKDLRCDIAILIEDYTELLNLDLYFTNIEEFEIQILYTLFYEFYPREEEEEEK